MIEKPFVYPEKNNILQSKPYLIEMQKQTIQHTKMPRCIHCHDDRIEILLLLKGKGIHQIGGKDYSTKADDLLIFDADCLHDERADNNVGLEILSCSIGNVHIKDLPSNHILQKNACPVIRDSYYINIIKNLLYTLYDCHNYSPEETSSEFIYHLLSCLILLVYKASIKNTEILNKSVFDIGNSIKTYIDKHYLEDIDIPSIAKAMKLGESYISHSFKKTTGYSVVQYIIRRRIGEAQSWLLMSNLSVTDIAAKVGYNNISNFQNTFRKMVGMSPKKYRMYWQKKNT